MGAAQAVLLLEKVREGDIAARDLLYARAFGRLRLIASSLLSRELRSRTLQATELVGELFLKLRGSEKHILSENQFYGLAARAMRQVLIDRARVRNAQKHIPPETVPALLANREAMPVELRLSVKAAYGKLHELDARIASTVWLRSVEGLTLSEVSKLQNRQVWRVRADFDFGVRWLADRIQSQAPSRSCAN